jgi:hypothetical protein
MREQIANHTIQRASRQYAPPPQDDPDEDDDYTTSMPRSAIRYPLGRPYTYQQGNRRIVFHPEPPPKKHTHWLLYFSVSMLAMLALWVGFQMLGSWWSAHQEDATYGFPRTYQVDAVVGHDDSAAHPTHFVFLNLKGRVVIIELPGGKVAQARIYNGPAIIGGNPEQTPVTADFQDVNGDGKLDMFVTIGTQQFTYLNDGAQFKPQQ